MRQVSKGRRYYTQVWHPFLLPPSTSNNVISSEYITWSTHALSLVISKMGDITLIYRYECWVCRTILPIFKGSLSPPLPRSQSQRQKVGWEMSWYTNKLHLPPQSAPTTPLTHTQQYSLELSRYQPSTIPVMLKQSDTAFLQSWLLAWRGTGMVSRSCTCMLQLVTADYPIKAVQRCKHLSTMLQSSPREGVYMKRYIRTLIEHTHIKILKSFLPSPPRASPKSNSARNKKDKP